jgi:hypothetical protein
MPDARWSRFVEYVRASLDYHTTEDDDLLKVHYATGSWQGIEEESAKITLLSNYPVPPEIVRGQLRIIAAFYEQDAIALTIGKSEVITPL